MPACRRHYPGRTERTCPLVLSSRLRPSPTNWRVSSCIKLFRGLLSVHSRYGLQTRGVAYCDPFHRRLQRLRYLHRRSDCYRVERSSSRAGLSSRCGPTPFTAHRNRDITTTNFWSRNSARCVDPNIHLYKIERCTTGSRHDLHAGLRRVCH